MLTPTFLDPCHFWGMTYKLSWRTDPCPSDWKSGLSPDSARDKAGHTRICASLTHEAVISQMLQPHRKVSLGIIANLRRIKMFLTDWPLHLFPEVTLVTIYCFYFYFLFFGVSSKYRHDISSCHGQVLHGALLHSVLAANFWVHICCPPMHNNQDFTFRLHSSTHLINHRVVHVLPCFEDGNYRQSVCNSPLWNCSFAAC